MNILRETFVALMIILSHEVSIVAVNKDSDIKIKTGPYIP